MDNDLHIVQQVRSARLKGIHLNILSDEDAGKISAMVINTVNEVSDAAFGLPTSNASECLTCGARSSKDCEGNLGKLELSCHFCGLCLFLPIISFPYYPYFEGRPKDGYPKMKFKVSSKDVFAKTAIIAEVNEHCLTRTLIEVYSILKHVCPKVLEALLKRKNSIFLNSLLVTPNSHRVREFGQRITVIRSEKLSSLEKIYEKQSANDSASSASGLKNIKELLLGKRTDHSFRMVVVGDPRIKVDEIGLPFQIAENVLISDHINLWNWDRLEPCCDFMLYRRGYFSVLRNGQRICIWSKDMLRTGDSICRPLIDGDVVLINRPPSIHQHSLIALSVRILPIKSVVSINPLVCSPLRGDFDGDCLHGYVPQSVTSRVELNELVSLNKQLHNGQNGQNLLSLSQDSLTAAYLFLEDGVLLNKPEMQQLQMFSSFMPIFPAIIKSTSGAAWTGKQLFGLLLPPDFEFAYASNDVCIRQGELVSSSHGSAWLRDSCDNLFQCLLRHCRDNALDFLHAAQEVLCEWLSRRGLSVSLSDLYLSSDSQSRKNILDEIYYGLLQAEKLSDISLLMVDCNQDFLVESSEEHENMENFLKEHMSIGQQTKAELFQASISASNGHADVSGTLTKRLMFFMRDLIIGYDGTVRSCYGNQVVQFDYCTEDTSATHSDALMAGHPVGSLAACAISEAAYSALDQPVSALEPSPLLALKVLPPRLLCVSGCMCMGGCSYPDSAFCCLIICG
ncbi:UNVERIFIED_CONTAM: DNA-directed RNA polymerase IV subunit [Sesamum radiatum]|uniref:DNA-directed RNA polymerase n=1 Tax=Sesamum radiatum TaxID=300843 RepID=A0AAW2MFG0_SESRA